MSLTAKTKFGEVKLAKDVNKNDGPFYCTFCNEEMILRNGMIKVPHFAHKKGSNCPYSTGETYEHEKAKLDLLLSARKMGIKADVEIKLSDHVRADVLLDFGDQKVAVEFQKSGMSVEQCQKRLKNYKDTGIPVIWIFLIDGLRGNYKDRRSVDSKIDFFSQVYFGKIYVLKNENKIEIWRIWKRKNYKMFRRWEKVGELSIFDKDKYFEYNRKKYGAIPEAKLWVVKDENLLGPNILFMEGKEIYYTDDSGGGIIIPKKIEYYFEKNTITNRWEVKGGITDEFGRIWDWEYIINKLEKLYILIGKNNIEKDLFIPDDILNLKRNKKEGNVLEDFL
jgi:hypothetical protein